MICKVEVLPPAIKELEKSARWYEKSRIGLGEYFINTIYKSFDAIAISPGSYPVKKKYREFVVKKFPFVIVYEFLEKDLHIKILHVFHTSRYPRHKYENK